MKGTVLSQEDGQPIVGAVVKIAGMKVGLLTDSKGHFEVTIPQGKKNLQISYVGYTTQTLEARNGMTVYLKEDAAALGEVVGPTEKPRRQRSPARRRVLTPSRWNCVLSVRPQRHWMVR